jgi:hypothetical protein
LRLGSLPQTDKRRKRPKHKTIQIQEENSKLMSNLQENQLFPTWSHFPLALDLPSPSIQSSNHHHQNSKLKAQNKNTTTPSQQLILSDIFYFVSFSSTLFVS